MSDIRIATSDDAISIQALCLATFEFAEARAVAQLAVSLLSESDAQSWFIEHQEKCVSFAGFSSVRDKISGDLIAHILAPLAVAPEVQKQGLGTRLVRYGIEALKAADSPAVLVYGDPSYYGRFGFDCESAKAYLPPFELTYPHGWQGLILDSTVPKAPRQCLCVPPLMKPELW